MTIEIPNVNYLAVLIASVIYSFIGALWYSPLMFGKIWMKSMGLTRTDIEREKNKGSIWKFYLANFLSNIVLVYILAVFLGVSNATSILGGMFLALLVWLGFIATVSVSRILWEGKSLKLYIINAAYHLLSLNAAAILIIVI